MIYILTSSPSVSMDGAINPANDFLYNLRQVVKQPSRCIFITTYPDDVAFSEHCSDCMRQAFEDVGFEFESYTLLDSRNARHARRLVAESDFIILGGGHVPSQNRFLRSMGFAKRFGVAANRLSRRGDGHLDGLYELCPCGVCSARGS